MAVNPKALASWGLLSDGDTQVVAEMEITVGAAEPLAVELEAAGISVELSDDQ
jgi:hypothetical protein